MNTLSGRIWALLFGTKTALPTSGGKKVAITSLHGNQYPQAIGTHETENSFLNLEFKLSVVKCGHVPISAHLQAQMKHLGTFIPLARSLTRLT